MRICILAGGDGTRWGEGDKTLLTIDGRPLLERTILQFTPHSSYIEVIGTNRLCNTESCSEEKLESFYIEVFEGSYDLFGTSTLILFGDTYYTDDAVRTILENTTDFNFFGRPEASKVTGKPYGEIFAFYYEGIRWEDVTKWIDEVRRHGERYNFWELYRWTQGIPLTEHRIANNFITIDDRTEDFDFREDYERWIRYSTV